MWLFSAPCWLRGALLVEADAHTPGEGQPGSPGCSSLTRTLGPSPTHGVRSPTSTVTRGRDAVYSLPGWPLSVSGLGECQCGYSHPSCSVPHPPPAPCSGFWWGRGGVRRGGTVETGPGPRCPSHPCGSRVVPGGLEGCGEVDNCPS